MKKKITAIALSFFLIGSAVLANNLRVNLNGFHFIAPAVNGKANVYSPAVGEIVYDSSDAGFWGYDQTGNWVSLNGGSGSGTPPGSLLPFTGSAAPTGYLIADGSAVNRTTYAALFAVIGTTYGAGDGSTTFNLPDARNVFLRGVNGSTRTIGGIAYPSVTLGATVNDKMQGHYHAAPPGSGRYVTENFGTNIAAYGSTSSTSYTLSSQVTTTGAPTSDGTNGTPRTGAETIPVNLGVNFIIKY